jgi:threonine synthase
VSSLQDHVSSRSPLCLDRCLGPLEPVYDYASIKLTREQIERRPKNLWRYRELLPITGEPKTGFHSGFTPLVRCSRLAERLGVSELYIKDDSVNHPTLSYKDRVVSVAATRAVELGLEVLACASTGNLANSVRRMPPVSGWNVACSSPTTSRREGARLPSSVRPFSRSPEITTMSTGCARRWRIGSAGVREHQPALASTRRARTYGFEIAEQLGWRFPQHVVSPVAGGTCSGIARVS